MKAKIIRGRLNLQNTHHLENVVISFKQEKNKTSEYTLRCNEDNTTVLNCQIITLDYKNKVRSVEGIKCSHLRGIVIQNCVVHSGIEDAIDFVRGDNIQLINNRIYVNKNSDQAITIKGGVKNVLIAQNIFYGTTKQCFIKLGDFSNYDVVNRPPVRNVTIERNYSIDGGQLYMAIHSEKPKINGNVGFKNKWWLPTDVPSSLVKVFFWYKKKFTSYDKLKPEDLELFGWEK